MRVMVTSNPLTSDVENRKLYYPFRTYSPLPLSHSTAFFTGFTCVVAPRNGMRKDIWQPFKERFNIPEIREFYRSTEGLAKFDNHGHGVWGAGTIGFSGPLRRLSRDQTFLTKVDPETQEPVRDVRTSVCQKVGLGEPGEAIGRCTDRRLLTEYFGNPGATEAKMMANVFQKGDLSQRMGDSLTQDAFGWV
ncbi:hypothetical protein LTR10_024376 [Elasticomyces elasticus]|uniref:Uncharacterized protein n=1 Tax=Exophiala sideris TaxID=1016849 RepID=A0ABR0IY82_9EURO|nr:hypothetical protein LTR10_024376 [Elasticomyces elasticus]KAK5022253.1 hypothetical protein LTS07_010129 [Exophiala sideris]KAK5027065.1 hypothetical protein LTR13_009675 [Exophiala sideris]KAK5051640.1 hypothetical protein LTR69_010140 [Exophiala sideris]KAK5177605.1 hypothetical protein LTR44_009795 [Eurotiomycetes sp. CCFEE 6388]